MLDGIKPRYEWFDGWRTTTATARKMADLPKGARAYLDRIETPPAYVTERAAGAGFVELIGRASCRERVCLGV